MSTYPHKTLTTQGWVAIEQELEGGKEVEEEMKEKIYSHNNIKVSSFMYLYRNNFQDLRDEYDLVYTPSKFIC